MKLDVSGLESSTRYYYRFQAPDGELSPVGTFTTTPSARPLPRFALASVADADGRWRPCGLTQDFGSLNLDFFIFLGDKMYETASSISPACADPFLDPDQALIDHRRKYRENITSVISDGFPSLQLLFYYDDALTYLRSFFATPN